MFVSATASGVEAEIAVPLVVARAAHEPEKTSCCCTVRPLFAHFERSPLSKSSEATTMCGVVTAAGRLCGERLPAASTALTVYVYEVEGATVVSLYVVAVAPIEAIWLPSRKI